ncbi:MAG: cob(I)yrinic acid a,c-diamide adenosyltransferase [Pirellulales bacterium]
MARIYTRTGDSGETGLFGGGRVRKDDLRVAAYGTVDELNAVLGVARCALAVAGPKLTEIDQFVVRVQHQLFNLGAELATPQPAAHGTNLITDADIAWLEQAIDGWEQSLAPLRTFILPGGSPATAYLHWARTVCRRAERLVVELAASEPIRGEVSRYVNRLSDALFVAARAANQLMGVPDVHWKQQG